MQFFVNMQGVGQGGSTSDVNANLVRCDGNINDPVAYFTYANSFSWIIDSEASERVSFHPESFIKSLR